MNLYKQPKTATIEQYEAELTQELQKRGYNYLLSMRELDDKTISIQIQIAPLDPTMKTEVCVHKEVSSMNLKLNKHRKMIMNYYSDNATIDFSGISLAFYKVEGAVADVDSRFVITDKTDTREALQEHLNSKVKFQGYATSVEVKELPDNTTKIHLLIFADDDDMTGAVGLYDHEIINNTKFNFHLSFPKGLSFNIIPVLDAINELQAQTRAFLHKDY